MITVYVPSFHSAAANDIRDRGTGTGVLFMIFISFPSVPRALPQTSADDILDI